jgi:hypothetical protein
MKETLYKVITQYSTAPDFSKEIQRFCDAGWQPLGACVILPAANGLCYSQTLTKTYDN